MSATNKELESIIAKAKRKPISELHNASVDPYKRYCAIGEVKGHAIYPDNYMPLRTSRIVKIDLKNNQIETLNTIYKLVNPDEQIKHLITYEEWEAQCSTLKS